MTKLKQLLYIVANGNSNINISKLSTQIGVSRATVLNYLHYMKNARLLTLLFDKESDDENGLKPNQVFLHNPNLLNAVCLDDTDSLMVRKTFLVSQLVCRGETELFGKRGLAREPGIRSFPCGSQMIKGGSVIQ